MADLLGIFEIAELAGVTPPAVANWRRRALDFPKPTAELKSGPVFLAQEIRAWLRQRRGTDKLMASNAVRIGLRLLEFECGITTNIDDSHSAELVDYEVSRTSGQAARLAMLIRGQDVIEDEQRLKKIAAIELGIQPAEYNAAKTLLLKADLIEERTTKLHQRVLNEKVNRLDHAENYQRIGELWLNNRKRSPKEEALIYSLDTVIQMPAPLASLDAILELHKPDQTAVLELGSNAAILDAIGSEQRLYYSPLLWDVDPKRLAQFLKQANLTSFASLLKKTGSKPGTDFTNNNDPLIIQAMTSGILPSYRVKSIAGLRVYSFAPYTGRLITSEGEKTVLEKARAIVACLRYGSEAASITRIRNPLWILNAITDRTRDYKLKPHSELKLQYGMLVSKQIGRVIAASSSDRYVFQLIPTEDNLRACAIARELMSTAGEVIADKDPSAAALHLVNGRIEHPLREVKLARKKRPARADELADLVERLQSV